MQHKSFSKPKIWILVSTSILFIIGSMIHFLYDILWENPLVGLLLPVNESVWEHIKMVLLPVILWWSFYYHFQGKQHQIDKNRWFTAALVALLTSFASIPLLYYFYTGAFGIQLLWVDILILLFALLFGQLLGVHIYRHCKPINFKYVLIILALIVLLFMIFTYFPPHIPLFQDKTTGCYGIIPHTLK